MKKTIQHFKKLNEICKDNGLIVAIKYDAGITLDKHYEIIKGARDINDYISDFFQNNWKKVLITAGIVTAVGGATGGLMLSVKCISDKSNLEGYLLGVQDGTINAVNEVYGTDLGRVKLPNDPKNTMLYQNKKTGKYYIIDAVETSVEKIAEQVKKY